MFLQLGPIWQGTLSFCMTTAAIKRKIHLKGSFIWFPERGKRSMGAHTVETRVPAFPSPGLLCNICAIVLERSNGEKKNNMQIITHLQKKIKRIRF